MHVGNTKPYVDTRTHQEPAVIIQHKETFSRCWEQIQKGDGMISESFPSLENTSVHWHTSTDSTQEMFIMNVLSFQIDFSCT